LFLHRHHVASDQAVDPLRVDESGTVPYFQRMLVKRLRQLVTLLIVVAYIGATTLQAVPSYAASADMNHAVMGGMMHDQDNPADKKPCKGMLPGCVTDVGCIFFVTLPLPGLTVPTVTVWSSVSYDNASQGLHGRTIKPALGPPIRFA
jgi:hypothetical protein